jgi:hypothetical protein
MIKHWIDLDALNWLPENPVYSYPLLRKQFTSTININKYIKWRTVRSEVWIILSDISCKG